MATKLLLLDCDSTLSSIEGIDELGRLRGPATFKAVEDMTNAAMNGGTPMEAIFAKRLDIIKPTAAELAAIGAQYIATVEPTAVASLAKLRAAGMAAASGLSMAHHEEAQIASHMLAAVPHGTYAECFADPQRDPVWQQMWVNRPTIKNGVMMVATDPGFGIALDQDMVRRFRSN